MLRANSTTSGAELPVSRLRLKRIALSVLLSGVLGLLPMRGHTAGLDCPEMVPNVLPDRLRLVSTTDVHELTNEIRYVVYRLQLERPDISYDELTDVMLAAYCPAVANLGSLSAAEKLRRMRQFDTILQQHLAGDIPPQGSLIVASVPLPPAVYRELRTQAVSTGQSTSQLMREILSRAAGN
jgi:hypothetical protein